MNEDNRGLANDEQGQEALQAFQQVEYRLADLVEANETNEAMGASECQNT